MKISNIDVDAALAGVKQQLQSDSSVSPSLRAAIELLMVLIQILTGRINSNSANSSKPPSQDPNRLKKSRPKSERKPGGQPGRIGKTLQPVEDPDAIQTVKLDRRTLPKGSSFRLVGHEKRQVIDLDISRFVTEYQAEILENAQGRRIVAPFPAGVERPVQYGPGLKAHAVYLSQYQLLPYDRIREYFEDQVGIPLSAGSLFNFNREAGDRAAGFEVWVKDRLAESDRIHADETSINIGGKRHWLHCASNDDLTWLSPHARRRMKASDRANAADSNAQRPATCWSGCAITKRMCCASWMIRRYPSPTTRVSGISVCSRCSRKYPAASVQSKARRSSAECAAICPRRASRS